MTVCMYEEIIIRPAVKFKNDSYFSILMHSMEMKKQLPFKKTEYVIAKFVYNSKYLRA